MKPRHEYQPICFYISICLCILSCNQAKQSESENLPDLFDQPDTISLNTKEGYLINPFLKDSVLTQIPINSIGDTIKTGSLYTITGKIIPGASIDFPKPVTAGKPFERPAYNNTFPVADNLKVIPIIENHPRRFIPGEDSTSFVLINSIGDTIPSGKAIPVLETKTKYRFIPPVYSTQKMARRYDAIYNIKILNEDQQLFTANVSALIEDRRGYLWIGMKGGGVVRYDGLSVTKFPFINLFVTDILEDTKGNLWIATNGGGVCRYDGTYITTFSEKNGLANNNINCLLEDKNGNIWFGTRGSGICCYHPPEKNEPGTLTHFTPKEGINGTFINKIFEDKNGDLWLGSNTAGVTYWKSPQRENKETLTHYTQQDGLFSNTIADINEDGEGNIWIATTGGACRYESPKNGQEGKVIQYIFRKGFPNPPVTKIVKDQKGNFWFGTYGEGAFQLINKKSQKDNNELFVQYTKVEGLSLNIIPSILEDKSGNVWLGTAGSGISCIRSRMIKHMGEKEGLTDYPINAMFEDRKGDVWFGTAGDGLIIYSPGKKGSAGSSKQFTTKKGLPSDFITSVTEDHLGNKWLGTTDKGLCLYDGKSFTSFNTTSGLSANDISTIVVDRNRNLWVGTFSRGISLIILEDFIKSEKPTFIQFTEKEGLLDNSIRNLYEDSQGNIWVASKEGFSRIEPGSNSREKKIIHYTEKEGLPSRFANTIIESKNKGMWFGTGVGVVQLSAAKDTSSAKLIDYTNIRQGKTFIIKSIREDPAGNIWIASNYSLDFLFKDQDSSRPYKQLKLYRPDGLKGTAFIPNSVLFDSDQQAWWGIESGGAEIVNLDDFEMNSIVPQPVLRGIEINDRYFDFRHIPDSLSKNISFDSVPEFENYPLNLSLTYDYNSLKFYFSATQLTNEHRVGYSFRMKGLNDHWSKTYWEPKVEFRSLPYGSYTFEVRAKGEPNEWSEPFEYSFRIRPPWWYAWWAYVMYSVIGCTVIYSTYQFQLSRKLALADKKRLVELDRVKNRLYSNITHEFRTPLTLIHGPVTQALSKNINLEQKDIQSIHRQSERLQQLINQMLELQKLEAGVLKPNYTYGEIIQALRYLFGSFESWAREKFISMIFSSSLQEVYMDFDKEKLTQIISNLISNALKHTPRNGKLAMELSTSPSGDFLLINITDTGIGISEEDLPKVFDRFYQTKKAAVGGTGIGLALVKNLTELLGGTITVESKPDIGSTFKLALPITKHAPKPIEGVYVSENFAKEVYDDESGFNVKQVVTTGKPIVLVVEDHPEVSQYIVSCLEPEFVAIVAMNGDDGIRMAQEHIPDLIISDVMMPGKDGFELCSILKTDIQTSHIPIILLTGRGDHEALISGIEHGADAYVVKPFDPDELKLRGKKLLELRTALSQYYRKHATTEVPNVLGQSSPKENEFMKKIRGVVEEHINDSQFNMDMLSKYMAMSHPQLHRKITALTGESTGKFVRAVRLTKAKELLMNSDLTISEIAYETGFSEPGYFTKIFSKEFNMTPTEFRGGLNG